MMSKSNLTTWEEVERYKEVALKTAAPLDGVIANLTHAALGLCTAYGSPFLQAILLRKKSRWTLGVSDQAKGL